jgi:hypothetical protein
MLLEVTAVTLIQTTTLEHVHQVLVVEVLGLTAEAGQKKTL